MALKEKLLVKVKEWDWSLVLEALRGRGAPDPSYWSWGLLPRTLRGAWLAPLLSGTNPKGAPQWAQKIGIPDSFPPIAGGLAFLRH